MMFRDFDMRKLTASICSAALMALTPGLSATPGPPVQSPIVGAWSLNKELTSPPPEQPQGDGQTGRRGNGRGRGGLGRGGFGGGGAGGRVGRGQGGNSEDVRRRQEATRAIMEVPDRLTIVQTETMVIVTTGDGRTTRLSLDGKKIKDDATGIERQTKWVADKLVSQITGAGPGKITESYAVDSNGRLDVTLDIERSGAAKGRSIHRAYDRADR